MTTTTRPRPVATPPRPEREAGAGRPRWQRPALAVREAVERLLREQRLQARAGCAVALGQQRERATEQGDHVGVLVNQVGLVQVK